MTTLKRLPRTKLSNRAADELKRLVANGTYRSGQKLPTEVELATALGVTRLTVREALSHLEASGLTSTHHGSGTYVVDLESQSTLDLMAMLLGAGRKLSASEMLALMEFRSVVVLGFAKELAARSTERDLSDLENVIAEERALLGKARRLAELDYSFNEILARASGNLFYTLLLRSVRALHVDLGSVIFSEVESDVAVVDTHAAIVKALGTKSLAKLEKSLELYLGGGTRVIQAWAAKKKSGRGA